jgi:hypothetical protein
MDRIRLYEAASNTEAMNEIKAACSNMRNCIRKYANGKANTNAKNEMLEGMKKIEADLKTIVKLSAKTGKKINEAQEPYREGDDIYAIWRTYNGDEEFELIWYAPSRNEEKLYKAEDKYTELCENCADVGVDDLTYIQLVRLPYTRETMQILADCVDLNDIQGDTTSDAVRRIAKRLNARVDEYLHTFNGGNYMNDDDEY